MENTLVWCKTKAQAVAVLTEAKKRGYNIDSPTEMGNRFWAIYNEETVVNLNGNGRSVTYCYKDWYIEHLGYGNIITANKFLGQRPILITRKGRVVTAEDKNTGEKAIATCSPTDTFDFGTGASIALARLMAKTPEVLTDDVKAEWKKVLGIKEVEKRVYTDDDRNFKVGDRVVVRDWGDMAKEYGTKGDSISLNGDSTSFVPEMKHLCGRTAAIADMNDDYVRVKFDDESGDTNWYFRRWMFNPSDSDRPTTKFKVGDLVTLKEGVKEGDHFGHLDVECGAMFDQSYHKPIKVIEITRAGSYYCAPANGSRPYFYYHEEMLEPWDENKIREGDKVHVKKGCAKDRYDTYYKWLKDNITDVDLLLGFERSDAISTTDTYTVVKIAPHGHFADLQLAFIKRTNGFGDTFSYLYDVEALEKVAE